MKEAEAAAKVGEINEHLQQMPWVDFEIMSYAGSELIVMGSLDISAHHDVEVVFTGLAFVCAPAEWKTDTARPPLSLVRGEAAVDLNRRFQVERGVFIFAFEAEDYPADFRCFIGARSISFRVFSRSG